MLKNTLGFTFTVMHMLYSHIYLVIINVIKLSIHNEFYIHLNTYCTGRTGRNWQWSSLPQHSTSCIQESLRCFMWPRLLRNQRWCYGAAILSWTRLQCKVGAAVGRWVKRKEEGTDPLHFETYNLFPWRNFTIYNSSRFFLLHYFCIHFFQVALL